MGDFVTSLMLVEAIPASSFAILRILINYFFVFAVSLYIALDDSIDA